MAADLTTTNLFLGIIALVSVLQAVGLIVLAYHAFHVSQKVNRAIDSVEHNQIGPALLRVQSILDDVKAATSVINAHARWLDRLFRRG